MISHDSIWRSILPCLLRHHRHSRNCADNIFITHVVPDEEDADSFQPRDPVEPPSPEDDDQEKALTQEDDFTALGLTTTLIDLSPITHVIPEDPESTTLNLHDELLRWHYRLGHLSFEYIKQVARVGQLPKCLLTSKKPFCSVCQFGKMTKCPWRVKGDNKNTTKKATQPGQIVSVDHLESHSSGLIAQLKGKLTQQRYKYATVFVNQFSWYTFVFLQKCLTSEETVKAKHTFECSAEQRGVKILHYHADNRQFADDAFIADCKAQRQSLSY